MYILNANTTILTPIILMFLILLITGGLIWCAKRHERKKSREYYKRFPVADRGAQYTDPTEDLW